MNKICCSEKTGKHVLCNFKITPFVDVEREGKLKVNPIYLKMGMENASDKCFVWAEVYEKLLLTQSFLPEGLKLCVLDGWRPFALL